MLNKKTLLFTAIAAILLTSCNPSVIEENDVYCTIHDLNDGTFETNYVKDAELFSNLGF